MNMVESDYLDAVELLKVRRDYIVNLDRTDPNCCSFFKWNRIFAQGAQTDCCYYVDGMAEFGAIAS